MDINLTGYLLMMAGGALLCVLWFFAAFRRQAGNQKAAALSGLILLLGTDARGETKYLRTDSMVVLSINRRTGQAKMTSVMRDIWVQIPGVGSFSVVHKK